MHSGKFNPSITVAPLYYISKYLYNYRKATDIQLTSILFN